MSKELGSQQNQLLKSFKDIAGLEILPFAPDPMSCLDMLDLGRLALMKPSDDRQSVPVFPAEIGTVSLKKIGVTDRDSLVASYSPGHLRHWMAKMVDFGIGDELVSELYLTGNLPYALAKIFIGSRMPADQQGLMEAFDAKMLSATDALIDSMLSEVVVADGSDPYLQQKKTLLPILQRSRGRKIAHPVLHKMNRQRLGFGTLLYVFHAKTPAQAALESSGMKDFGMLQLAKTISELRKNIKRTVISKDMGLYLALAYPMKLVEVKSVTDAVTLGGSLVIDYSGKTNNGSTLPPSNPKFYIQTQPYLSLAVF
jgi:hypothetical protein